MTGQNPTTGVAGLPVAGYKPMQPPEAVAAVNRNKHLEELILRDMDELAKQARNGSPLADPRWLAVARTQIEKAFMSYNRAIFQPTRVAGELMVDVTTPAATPPA